MGFPYARTLDLFNGQLRGARKTRCDKSEQGWFTAP